MRSLGHESAQYNICAHGYTDLYHSTKTYQALFIDKHFYLLIDVKAQILSVRHPACSEEDATRQPGSAISEDLIDNNNAPPVHLQLDCEPIYSQLLNLQIYLVWRPSNSRCTRTSINPTSKPYVTTCQPIQPSQQLTSDHGAITKLVPNPNPRGKATLADELGFPECDTRGLLQKCAP